MKQKIAEKFQTLFQEEGEFFASAGRINLIGEHTDYNGGFVFPGAIDKGMIAEIKLNGTKTVRAFALDLDEYCEFGLNEEDAPTQSWARYIFGVCREIQKRGGTIGGFDTVFAGDVPLGAGMSSSAALESTFAFALNELFVEFPVGHIYCIGIFPIPKHYLQRQMANAQSSTLFRHNICGRINDKFYSHLIFLIFIVLF